MKKAKIIIEVVGIDSFEHVYIETPQLSENPSQTEEKTERFLSTQEAADCLGVSIRTLFNYRQPGMGLAFHQIGSKVLYREEDLKDFANRFKVGGQAHGQVH